MKPFLIVLLLISCIFARREQPSLNTGWRNYDTITEFGADSIKYTSRAYNFSGLRYLRVDLFVDDSSTAGLGLDTTALLFGVQTGHVTIDSAGLPDTAWSLEQLVIDTLDIANGTIGAQRIEIGTNGTYTTLKNIIDTVSVVGWAYQTSNIAIPFDGLVRGFVEGITGNKVHGFLEVRMQFLQGTKEP
jgi:hypothetical protein